MISRPLRNNINITDQRRALKIAYYSINDPLDKRSWSGITYYLGQSLQKNVGVVHFLGPVTIPWLLDKLFRAIQKLSRFFFKTEWIPKYSLLKNYYAAWVLKKRMKGQYDLVIAPAAAPELAYLNTKLPVIYYGDATYRLYSTMYLKEFANLNSFSRWEGNYLEQLALNKSTLAIFSSGWAAESAVLDYGIDPNKTAVIQMGANIDQIPSYEVIFEKKKNKTLTLLFLSVDWDRKGGPIAYETLTCLIKSGHQVKLVVCGCVPPDHCIHTDMEVIPFLNKNLPADFNRFTNLLINSHFLLLPTRADCTPLVNCEANSYGMPAITTDVGGVNEAVKNGVNGYCLPLEAGGTQYAELISEIFNDSSRYHDLILSSRQMFDQELNWDSFSENLKLILQKHNIPAMTEQCEL